MSMRATLDVSALPDHGFGSRSPLWWGIVGMIAIEATVFVLAIASYFYLQGTESQWPPGGTDEPGLLWASVNVGILLVSLIPNQLAKNAAERQDLGPVRRWMIVADAFAVAFVIVRVLEYGELRVNWDTNAYGSITWTLLSLHSIHLVTDLIDSIVLTTIMFTRHGREARRMVEVSENAFYWYFVVLAWIPIYLVVYWSPRWL